MKRICMIGLALALVFALSGCSLRSATMRYRPIDDIHDLDGRRIGVSLAWSADYLLTGREDMELMRYNSLADAVVAMCYKRVDAIAIERAFASTVLRSVQGVRIVEAPLATTSMLAFVNKNRPDILSQFNEFVEEFPKTPEYADLMRRVRGIDEEFEERYVAPTGTGPVLRVGMESGIYPFIYYNYEDDAYYGMDAEIITHFANAYNYRIEFTDSSYEAMIQSLVAGRLDICIGGLSEFYREEVELSRGAFVSEPYMDMDIVFVEIDDASKLKIVANIDL